MLARERDQLQSRRLLVERAFCGICKILELRGVGEMRRGERVSRVEKEKKCRKREGKSSRVDRTLVDQFNILESSRDNLS